jgi:hypothetical protein
MLRGRANAGGGTPANDYCFFSPGRSNLQIPGSRIDCFHFKALQNDSARSTLAKMGREKHLGWSLSISQTCGAILT